MMSFPGLKFHIASYREFVEAALADNPEVPSLNGTLRHSAHSCTGCISARLRLKRENAKAYTTIEHFAETVFNTGLDDVRTEVSANFV